MPFTHEKHKLNGKVAIVTGAGRGIGKAIAIAYAAEGAAVGCAARTLSEIETTAAEITNAGGRAIAVQTDVTDLKSVSRLFNEVVSAFGGLDILVVNAAKTYDHRTVVDSDPEAWLATLDVSFIGAYYCMREAIPYLRKNGTGKILTIGSGLGHNGRAATSAHACSKAALWMLTRVLAQELWDDNISVNELIPGPVTTYSGASYASKAQESVFDVDSEWVKRPEDVVPMALFIATQPNRGPSARSFSLLRRDD
ncbi:MAG: SDR family oxidoreductase [Chloroflexi bacterium]|nr:SDR family oxidoreductase [Chloroflexota bacterium]MYK62142.1 SDR family oxidoreductase [Chloroflexota bacterium]